MKLAEIKARVMPGYLGLSSEDAAWLVAEVERLRADAALGAAVRRMRELLDGAELGYRRRTRRWTVTTSAGQHSRSSPGRRWSDGALQ